MCIRDSNITGVELGSVVRGENHVRAALTGVEGPVDTLGAWVVTSDAPARLRSEVKRSFAEDQAVRATQLAQIDAPHFLARGNIDNGECIARDVLAVVTDEGQLAIA